MLLLIKIGLILTLAAIAYQDIKERQVYWFLFPTVAVFCAVLHHYNTLFELFKIAIVINIGFIGLLFFCVYGYARIKMNTTFEDVIGLGDVLLFIALAFSFAAISFITLFIFSLFFSLVLHLALKAKSKHTTVPLAGFVGLFFSLSYLAYWFGLTDNLYTI